MDQHRLDRQEAALNELVGELKQVAALSKATAAKVASLEAIMKADAAAARSEAKIRQLQSAMAAYKDSNFLLPPVTPTEFLAILAEFMQGNGHLIPHRPPNGGSADTYCMQLSQLVHKMTGVKPRITATADGARWMWYD